jgi:hypothetical protein
MEMKGMIKKAVMAGVIGTIGLVSMASVVDAGNKASVQVTATVQPMISQIFVQQENALVITRENVKNGYVDVPAATVLQVRTNSRNGYYLTFELNGQIADEVWIMDGNKTTVLTGGIGSVHQSSKGFSTHVKKVSYRFLLHPDTQPGLYAWPINVGASLL